MIRIHAAGGRATIQDAGRFGHLREGLPPSGPADPSAFFAAQWLVGNDGSKRTRTDAYAGTAGP